MVRVGERIAQERENQGLTTYGLAKRAHVSHQYMSQVESGKIAMPARDKLTQIAAVLGVPIESLTGEDAQPPDAWDILTSFLRVTLDPEDAEILREEAEKIAALKAARKKRQGVTRRVKKQNQPADVQGDTGESVGETRVFVEEPEHSKPKDPPVILGTKPVEHTSKRRKQA